MKRALAFPESALVLRQLRHLLRNGAALLDVSEGSSDSALAGKDPCPPPRWHRPTGI